MKTTPLHATHVAFSAKMGEFAGYDMPLYYADGVLKEHEQVRASAGIFDVSHMGQIILEGAGVIEFLEKLTPSSFAATKPFTAKYTVLTNEEGGIVDDLIITKLSDTKFFTVINAGCKEKDIEWIKKHLPAGVTLTRLDDRALIALQGPKAEAVLKSTLGIDASGMGYMKFMETQHGGKELFVSRLGYTGEDGFELSVPEGYADYIWRKLADDPAVKPIGLAARDSLRLEMGYCLYGHDIDATTTPLEADLSWVMSKTNTSFIGAQKALAVPKRKRIGVKLMDKGVAREGAEIRNAQDQKIGILTSGSFSPTLKESIGQGYVDASAATIGADVFVNVRGRNIPAKLAAMPFTPPKTKAVKKAA